MKDAKVQVMGIDAGGTMTDTFFVKENGSFVVGKAQSNPEDESLAIYNSSQCLKNSLILLKVFKKLFFVNFPIVFKTPTRFLLE